MPKQKPPHWSTWFKGSETEWKRLPIAERDALSFKHTGCAVAYPTWAAPVDCVHLGCRVLRGELPRVAYYNGAFQGERSNWLRFIEDRRILAKVYWYGKKEWIAKGRPSNAFSLLFVYAGVGAIEVDAHASKENRS